MLPIRQLIPGRAAWRVLRRRARLFEVGWHVVILLTFGIVDALGSWGVPGWTFVHVACQRPGRTRNCKDPTRFALALGWHGLAQPGRGQVPKTRPNKLDRATGSHCAFAKSLG